MSLEILMGSMFSGKSTELIRRVKRRIAIGRSVRVVNHAIDTRVEGDNVKTHDDCTMTATKVPTLEIDLLSDVDVIAVDEIQFFSNIKPWVENALKLGKHVILAGLDGDFKQEKFGELFDVIPLADEVLKLRALCMICNDGTPGPFTQRTIVDDTQVVVAAADSYRAVCRRHLLKM